MDRPEPAPDDATIGFPEMQLPKEPPTANRLRSGPEVSACIMGRRWGKKRGRAGRSTRRPTRPARPHDAGSAAHKDGPGTGPGLASNHAPSVRERQDSGPMPRLWHPRKCTPTAPTDTTRNPLLSFRLSGLFLLRFAERQFCGLLFQQPPRSRRRLYGPVPLERRARFAGRPGLRPGPKKGKELQGTVQRAIPSPRQRENR